MSDTFLLDEHSLAFAEDFKPAGEEILNARDEAIAAGADSVSNGVCTALTFLARCVGAKNVVEVGTGSGASGLALFAGMDPAGVLTSIDTEGDWQARARDAFKRAEIPPRRVRLIPGEPLSVLGNLRDAAYDLMFVNGNKLAYVEYIAQAGRLLRSGGILVCNDVLWHNLVANPADDSDESVIIREAIEVVLEDEGYTPLVIPLGEGLLAAIKS